MAILEGEPGLRVWVQSSNQSLPEYPDNEEKPRYFPLIPVSRKVSKYVECVSDTEFQVHFEVTPPFKLQTQSLNFQVSVDGVPISQLALTKAFLDHGKGNWRGSIDSRVERISPTEVLKSKLKFRSINKVDDNDYSRVKKDKELVAGMGKIVITIYRTRQVPGARAQPSYKVTMKDPPKEVAEKAVKGQALSHGVAFGAAKRRRHPISMDTIEVDGKDHPIGVFDFKYRSRAALQSELIIPRSPSPGLGPVPVEARLANLKKEIQNIKDEKEADGRRERKRRSSNEIPRSDKPLKTSRRSDGSTLVDLTDD